MKNFLSISLCIICTFAVSSHAKKEPVPRINHVLKQLTEQNGRACVRVRNIRGYGSSKGSILTIDGGHNYFIATTLPGCFNLNSNFRAAFVGRFGEICGHNLSKVITGHERCTIGSMYQFDSRKEAFTALRYAREIRNEAIAKNADK